MIRNTSQMIYKFPLPVTDRAVIKMPAGAEVLCVQVQDEQPCIWAKVFTKEPIQKRVFYVVGTGHPMPIQAGAYVGTFQLREGQLVFHVFEEGP